MSRDTKASSSRQKCECKLLAAFATEQNFKFSVELVQDMYLREIFT